MRRYSVIAQSDQTWKVIVGLVLLIGGAVIGASVTFLPYLRAVASDFGQFYNVRALSTAVAAVGFAYLCIAIRCPKCGAKWIWMAVSGKLGARSLDALVLLNRCPTCGYAGRQETDRTAL
jgi:hypothetical protein